jgi:hypothetical protein
MLAKAFSAQIDAPKDSNLLFDRVIRGSGDSTCADHALALSLMVE